MRQKFAIRKAFPDSAFDLTLCEILSHSARFAKFVTDVVGKRKLPNSAGVTKPRYICSCSRCHYYITVISKCAPVCQCSTTHFRVVIKADIEGAELKIIPDMVRRNAFNKLSRAAQKDKFLVIVFNKESADVLTLRIFQVWP